MIAEEQDRRDRLARLYEAGVDPFPARVSSTHTVHAFLEQFETLKTDGTSVSLTGRVRAIRQHGGLSFIRFQDASGKTQALCKKDLLGDEAYAFLFSTLDTADFVQVEGTAVQTKTGESAVLASRIIIIAKALLPLPEKWHGLSDVETRFRFRELDLLSNDEVRQTFVDRARMITALRTFFDGNGFMEVDTPILQHIAAGASAAPFVTHHNGLDEDVYLRIAPELYLKRLVVGGFDRVYEIARCFRNEGIDTTHNPEFSQVEAYAAYTDYSQLMDMMEALLQDVIRAMGKDPAAIPYQGDVLSFASPIERVTYTDLFMREAQVDVGALTSVELARSVAREQNVPFEETDSLATLIDTLFKKLVRPRIIQPIFVTDYPAFMTPLAKRKADDPDRVEMFQLVVGRGLEVMKAFSELNDPIDQEARMDEQESARAAGDDEAQRRDDEFLTSMKHGMPPMSGVGIGIERLCQVLTDAPSIKEVMLFPMLRSEQDADSA